MKSIGASSPREVDHRIDEPLVERQHGDRLREVGEGLKSVDDAGVHLPLHDDPGDVILLERVAALAAAGAATPGDQPFEEGFALRCDRRHLGVVEDSLSDHVPVSLQREELGLVQPVLPHASRCSPMKSFPPSRCPRRRGPVDRAGEIDSTTLWFGASADRRDEVEMVSAGWNGLGVGLSNLWRLADAETRSISPENFDR